MKKIEAVTAALFGLLFVGLSVAVAAETVMRKVFNRSLQGVDELGGYILAIGAALAFTTAIVARAHIRIDLIHDRLPRPLRAMLNVVALVALALTAGSLFWMAWHSWQDSIALNSIAQTPWATPLRYPQTAWVAALGVFALVALGYALHALVLLLGGRVRDLDERYPPRSTKDELNEELADIAARGAADQVPGVPR
jgi:TRAP-type C4-dicarboxylate transport system permease small subunit